MLGRLADLTSRRPKQILAGTVVFFFLCAGLGAPVVGLLSGTPKPDPEVESTIAEETIERASGIELGGGLIALVQTGTPVRSAAAREKVQQVIETIEREPQVVQTADFYSTRNRAFVSKDRRSTYVVASFKPGDKEIDEAAENLKLELEKQPGVLVGGGPAVGPAVGETIGEDLAKAEQLAFPLLFVAALFVFRGLVAALLPLLIGMITVFGTFLFIRIVNGAVTEISVFALNMVIALGLGLAIDYSLFIVSRYREEVARSGYGPEALKATMQTAGPYRHLQRAHGGCGARIAARVSAEPRSLDGLRRRGVLDSWRSRVAGGPARAARACSGRDSRQGPAEALAAT